MCVPGLGILAMNIENFCLYTKILVEFKIIQEIVSAGGRTIWGNPAEIGNVVGGESFDVVLDNNGKDLDAVRFVA